MRATLCIDLEPDGRDGSGSTLADWSGASSVVADAGWIRTALAPAGPAPISWFVRVDPQIEAICGAAGWALERFARALEPALDAGDDLGVHPHSYRWAADASRWINDWSDDWTESVVSSALSTFESTTGRPCRIYRHGDRYTSPALVRLLLASEVVVDLTLEPGTPALMTLLPTEVSTGGVIPHVDPALSRPFQPDPACVDLPVPPDGRLTMVPMTTVAIPNGRHEVLWLTTPPAEFRRRLRIRLLDPTIDHLAFVVRSDLMVQTEARDAITANLCHLGTQVPDLEWVRATAFAGTAHQPEDFRADASGALAAQADAVLDAHGVTTSMPAVQPVLAAERAVRELASARHRLRSVEGTTTWRVHDRLLPLLRPLARARGRLRM